MTGAVARRRSYAPHGGPPPHTYYIYWTNRTANSVGRANLDGTGANNSFITGMTGGPEGIAVSASYIYIGCNGGQIYRANLDGSGLTLLTTTTNGGNQNTGLAVDATFIYAAEYSNNTIDTLHLDGTNWTHFLTNVDGAGGDPGGVCATSAYLYVTANFNNNRVVRYPIGGGSATTLVTGCNRPYQVNTDGTYLFWANNGNNTIGQSNLDGSSANQAFITGSGGVQGVAAFGGYVYWTEFANNHINRAAIASPGSPTIPFIGTDNGPYCVTVA